MQKLLLLLLLALPLLALPLLALPCSAEVKFISDTGFIVENQVQTSQPPALAWQVLVEKVDLWWPKDLC